MITYNLFKTGSASLYEQLFKYIKNDILGGILKPGEKLPSKRMLAKNLGVSVITVESAYAQLIAEGYIYSIPKRGFYISDFRNIMTGKKESFTKEMAPLTGGETAYFADFSSSETESDLFPFTIWSKAVREVLSDSRVQLMTNSPCGGIYELRRSISSYLKDFRNMSVQPEQIIIGAGTEYLYGLLIQLFGGGRVYAVEDPGYRKPELIYKSFDVPCRRVPVDSAGINIAALEKSGADIIHITPSHQYPTGIVMPVSRRYELLGWAAGDEGRYIIEDDYDSELRLSGQPVPPLQSIDVSDRVIYMNTFSKTLSSTVRISYMVLPPPLSCEFYRKLSFYSCTVSNFEQYTLAKFMEEGKFDMHINRLRSYYRKKRDTLLDALRRSRLGEISTVSGEEAGLHFLMTVHTGLPEAAASMNALSYKIKLVPLSDYCSGELNTPENVYVMNYSSVDVSRADEIMERLYKSFAG